MRFLNHLLIWTIVVAAIVSGAAVSNAFAQAAPTNASKEALAAGAASAEVATPEAEAEAAVDHPQLIRSLDQQSFERGQNLYATMCLPCHGTLDKEGSLPTSRAFWKEPFKNGSDPLSLYRTLTHGLGQMPAWPFLTPEQRYDVIHYVREALVKPTNPAAYFPVTPEYLAKLPKPRGAFQKTAAMLAFEKGPRYLRMDFGPVLFWTIGAETNNIAYKGIAVRLDEGAGGISKGRAWLLYDHDTMRVVAGWSGDGFLDWKGIAFDGSHGTHASIVGQKAFVNPVGPGWANPKTGRFEDPRLLGLDGKPYGPLPRYWAHLKGVYLNSSKIVLSYTVGDASILESPGCELRTNGVVYLRALEIGKSSHNLLMRVAPESAPAAVSAADSIRLIRRDGFHLLEIPAQATPVKLCLRIGDTPGSGAHSVGPATTAPSLTDLPSLTRGGPARWKTTFATRGKLGASEGPFAVDELTMPSDTENPWQTWMRFGGFDFFPDGDRAAICTWNGDVWLVSGIAGDLRELRWKRIASGLFQPLGVKIIEGKIYAACRDQIARLHDFNGDDEVDFIENFNSDHQVTEHFHEFAMGLQTDAEGNFYYAKSARHALPPLVPHHGTLLKVSHDGARTEIVASGFRAANGVCVNEDGTFFVTDQEGHWIPKNRINWVRSGGFYGNMWSYHHPASSANDAMAPPVVWITNEMDRSPGELVRVTSRGWGPLYGSLLNLSYGTGRIYLVPVEKVGSELQGGVAPLPIPNFPTGVMRGRFHPANGHLYACGMVAWASNQPQEGGFYRVRSTGQPAYLPVGLHARRDGLELVFSDPLDSAAAEVVGNYSVKTWSLRRSANYGSKHYDERVLRVDRASVSKDGRVVHLQIPQIQPTWCMEVKYELRGRDGEPVTQTIHNTIHSMGDANASERDTRAH